MSSYGYAKQGYDVQRPANPIQDRLMAAVQSTPQMTSQTRYAKEVYSKEAYIVDELASVCNYDLAEQCLGHGCFWVNDSECHMSAYGYSKQGYDVQRPANPLL